MLPHQAPEHRGRYSLRNLIRAQAEGRSELASFEIECSAAIAERSGRKPRIGGLFVPLDIEARDLTTTTGTGAVVTRRPPTIVEALRNRLVVARLGGVILDELEPGKVQLPRWSAGSAAGWVSESSPLPAQSPTMDAPVLSPRLVGCYLDVSRPFLSSASPGAEDMVRGDLLAAIAEQVDLAALAGGGSPAPTGILNNSSVATLALGTNGAAMTWANVCEMERLVGAARGERGPLSLVTTPNNRKVLRTTAKVGGSEVIWSDADRVGSMTAVATTAMPANGSKGTGTALSSAIVADFSSVVVGLFGAVEIFTDPTQFGRTGEYRTYAFQFADTTLRHPESAVKCVDIVAS